MRNEKKHKSISLRFIRYLLRIWQERLTAYGRILFLFLVISASLGSFSLALPFYFFFCVIFSVFFVAEIFCVFLPLNISVEVSYPDKIGSESEFEIEVKIKNAGRGFIFGVSAAPVDLSGELKMIEHSLPVSAGPGDVSVYKYKLKALKRGFYRINAHRIETAFPFGVWKKSISVPCNLAVTVYPRFWPLSEVKIPVGRKYQPGGFMLSSKLGDSMEFIGDREYVAGDLVKNIHWNAWARMGKPIVKEFMEEYFCRVALVLDTFAGPLLVKKKREDTFEAAVSVAASVASVLARKEYIVDIFAEGSKLYYLRAGRSFAYLGNILDLLACVDLSKDNKLKELAASLEEEIPAITTFVIVFLDWDKDRERFCHHLTEGGCALKRIIVRDLPCSLDPITSSESLGEVVVLNTGDARECIDVL